jgi:N-acetylglucosaminyldiphosphoundecaprenol N-acetyl-beta-D-mannosaminyltransferase
MEITERNLVNVLGVHVDRISMSEALDRLEIFINQQIPHIVATANAEMVMMAQADPELRTILNAVDMVLPDGAGVVWAARQLGSGAPERVAGYDLTQKLLERASTKGYRVFWLGAAPGIAVDAVAHANELYPGLLTVGIQDGYFSSAEETMIIKSVADCRPDILLCALGVPKQEKWLFKNIASLHASVVIGVGGTFDVMAGRVTRAPLWMQNAGLEWSYRLIRQPGRFIRMLALPRFVVRVLWSAWTRR